MAFTDFYFDKYQVWPQLISTPANSDVNIIVTIPSFKEENTIKALEGLFFCRKPKCKVEVIVLVNYPENERGVYENMHLSIFRKLLEWVNEHSCEWIKFFPILIALPGKDAGVGLARKIAMDEALRRFNSLGIDGIITGFDADSTCTPDYFTAIEEQFLKSPATTGCSLWFEHPTEGNEYPQNVYDAIVDYELYLRYYVEALRYAQFPYAYQTLGSSFAVRASVYAKQGGMNKRKAGEDFYFLHKIISLGNYAEVHNTTVIPSPRESDRVPFGTGAAISKILSSSNEYSTFNPAAFEILKNFFSNVSTLWKNQDYDESLGLISNAWLFNYIQKQGFKQKLAEFHANSGSETIFRKRFFSWFNGLMVLQFLNELHVTDMCKVPIVKAVQELMQMQGVAVNSSNKRELLAYLNKIHKGQIFNPQQQ